MSVNTTNLTTPTSYLELSSRSLISYDEDTNTIFIKSAFESLVAANSEIYFKITAGILNPISV